MVDRTSPSLPSETIDPGSMRTLEDLCQTCNVDAEWIVALVDHGMIEPAGQSRLDWQFESVSVIRVAKAKRLERDLNLNPPGVALVLDLLDEIDQLRSRLRSLEGTSANEQTAQE